MPFEAFKKLVILFFAAILSTGLLAGPADPVSFPVWHDGQSVSYQYKVYRNGILEKIRNFKWAVFGPRSLTTTTATYFDFEIVTLTDNPLDRFAMSVPVASPGLDSARYFHVFMGDLDLLGSNVYRVKIGEDLPYSAFFRIPTEKPKNLKDLIASCTITESVQLSTTAGTFDCRQFHFGQANNKSSQDPVAFDYFQNASIPVTGIVACHITQNVDNIQGGRDRLETKIEYRSSTLSGEVSEFSGVTSSAGSF